MTIAQVCPYDFTVPGGVQQHVRGLSRELRRRGHQVREIAPRWSYRVPFGGTRIDLAGSPWRELRQSLAGADLIHLHTPWNPWLGWQVTALAGRRPMVATLHDTPGPSWAGRLAGRLLLPAAAWIFHMAGVDEFVAVSPVAAASARWCPRHFLIPNGLDLEPFLSARPWERYVDGKFTVLFLGRRELRKGLPVLLEAFRRLKPNYPQLRLLVVGGGGPPDLEMPDLEWAGVVSEEDKPRYYASCDLFCSPALYGESFGIVLVEAMAAGKPALGAANPGYAALLWDQASELLTPPGDVAALAERIAYFMDHPAAVKRLGAWGRERARRYAWPAVVDEVEKVYRLILEGL